MDENRETKVDENMPININVTQIVIRVEKTKLMCEIEVKITGTWLIVALERWLNSVRKHRKCYVWLWCHRQLY